MSGDAPSITPTSLLSGRDRLLLALISLAVLLPGTYSVSLADRDEGWYAQVSREMLQTGDWLIPHYLGQPWIAKPPLLYWCVAAAFALFGVHAWAARLVSVLAMLGAVQLTATLGTGLGNRRVAWIASVSFITAALPATIGKLVLTDALLLVCCLAAMLLLWRIVTRGASLARSTGFWLFLGLAILAKGPAAFVFVGPFALALLVISRPLAGKMPGPQFWLAFPVCLAVAAPWYIYVGRQAGGTFWQQFVGAEIASRLISTPHGHGGPPGYYLLLSLAGWMPWTVLVPGAVLAAWRARRDDRIARLLLIWCFLPWLFLELIPSKLPHYILPCYVPLAILFGRMWDGGVQRAVSRRELRVLGLWVAVAMLCGAALIVAGGVWHMLAWGAAGAALVVGFLVVGGFVRQRRLLLAWGSAVGAAVLFQIVVGLWALPELEPYRLSRQVAEQANALCGATTEVLVSGYTEPTVFFYLDRPARVVGGDEIRRADAGRVLIVRDAEARAAGLAPEANGGWQRLEGFNYVKGRRETVWITRCPP